MSSFRHTSALTSAALFAVVLSATAQSAAPPASSTAPPPTAEPAPAQVTGGQAPQEEQKPARPAPVEDIEVPSPLLVQVSLLPTKIGGRSLATSPLLAESGLLLWELEADVRSRADSHECQELRVKVRHRQVDEDSGDKDHGKDQGPDDDLEAVQADPAFVREDVGEEALRHLRLRDLGELGGQLLEALAGRR